MYLSIQSNMVNKNTNYTLKSKVSFKGKFLTPEAFAAENKIIEKIKTLPNNIFLDSAEFTKFCKSIDITPKINGAITKKLIEVRQTKMNSKSFIV